jgi:hypothetical protein
MLRPGSTLRNASATGGPERTNDPSRRDTEYAAGLHLRRQQARFGTARGCY